MTRADYLAKCKAVRAYIGANPGKTRLEIEAATGHVGCVGTLVVKRLIRQEGGNSHKSIPPKYYIITQ
jgi:hypothetical protein